MSFRSYLEDEADKPYYHLKTLAWYYEDMENKEKLIKDMAKEIVGYDKKLNLSMEEIEKRIADRLIQWDERLQSFDGSVKDLLTEWVDDGTIDRIIDTSLIDEKITPLSNEITGINTQIADRGVTVRDRLPNELDDIPAIRDAYNQLPESGGSIFFPHRGRKYVVSGAGATVENPIVVLNIQKPNVHIYAHEDVTILMDGFTLAHANATNEPNGDEIFTVFLFNNVNSGSIKGIRIDGLADGITSIGYPKARAKGIGITDCENIKVDKVFGYRIVGNAVNARGRYKRSRNISVTNSHADGCSENGFNYMGGADYSTFANNHSKNNGFHGFESGSDFLICYGNTFENNKNGMSHVGKYSSISRNVLKGNKLFGLDFQYNNLTYSGSHNVSTENIICDNGNGGINGSGSTKHNKSSNDKIFNNGNGTVGDGIKLNTGSEGYTILSPEITDTNTENPMQVNGINAIAAVNLIIKDGVFRGNKNLSILTQAGGDNHLFTGNTVSKPFSLSGSATNVKVFDNPGHDSTNFIQPVLTNGWVNFGSTSQVAGYWKDSDGMVHLRGSVKSGTLTVAIFNLPPGFRPSLNETFIVDCNNTVGFINIATSGNVILNAGDNAKVSLSGIKFKGV